MSLHDPTVPSHTGKVASDLLMEALLFIRSHPTVGLSLVYIRSSIQPLIPTLVVFSYCNVTAKGSSCQEVSACWSPCCVLVPCFIQGLFLLVTHVPLLLGLSLYHDQLGNFTCFVLQSCLLSKHNNNIMTSDLNMCKKPVLSPTVSVGFCASL